MAPRRDSVDAVSGQAEGDAARERLLDAASRVFGEKGYYASTVREIVGRAGTNVAAVNYYFQDKLGLYVQVLQRTICSQEHQSLRQALSSGGDARAQLGRFVAVMLRRASSAEPGALNFHIMAHEMARPTPALPEVVRDMIRPNYEMLRGLVGQVLESPPDSDTVRLCVHSLIGQVLHYVHARPVIQILWPELSLEPTGLDRIAEHITRFTLGAMSAMAEAERTTR